MDLGLKGKVALVFGATGGLGGAMATSLAKEGAKVALAGRNASALSTLATSLRSTGAEILELPWDLADLSVIERNFATIESTLGAVNGGGGAKIKATTRTKIKNHNLKCEQNALQTIFYNRSLKLIYVK